jgi:hypothetical protein
VKNCHLFVQQTLSDSRRWARGADSDAEHFVEAGGAQPGAGGRSPASGWIGVAVVRTDGAVQACGVEHRRAGGRRFGQQVAAGVGCPAYRLLGGAGAGQFDRVGDVDAHLKHLGFGVEYRGEAGDAELAKIPTTNAQYQAKTVVFTKIAAQQAYSVEVLEDTNSDVFAFAGSELSRKLIDAESDFLVNNTDTSNGWSKGLMYADNTQSLSALSYDSPIDAILAAYELIRSTTQSFARANLVLVSPATGLALRTVKATTGLYVLDQNNPSGGLGQDQFVSLFGATLVQNTKVPDGYAVVLDSTVAVLGFLRSGLRVENTFQAEPYWSEYAWSFRATERLGLAYPWPQAIVIIDSLPVTPGLVFTPGSNSS